MPVLATNKKAFYDYEILKSFEAGLVLTGQEVKSARKGSAKLKGSYVVITGDEAFILNMHIPKYAKASSLKDYDPYRSRKLLLKRKELNFLIGKNKEKGLTFIPTKLYTKFGRIKLEFGIGRGKKKYEKKETIKKRDLDRQIKRKYGV